MIWLVGCKGMLGHELGEVLRASGLDFVGTDREVDFTNFGELEGFCASKFKQGELSHIINCAAYTAVDKAEDEIELCTKINVDGPRNLARLSKLLGAVFIHFSTDYVFDGIGILENGNIRPYKETDPIGPTGVYGRTKAEAELEIAHNASAFYIIRTAWLYGLHGNNFVFTMLKLMKERESLGVINDQFGSPTWAYDLSTAVVSIMDSKKKNYGVYHYSGDGLITWYDFAVKILECAKSEGLVSKELIINPLTTEQYPTKAKRPAWSVLDKTKITTEFGIKIEKWEASLQGFMRLAKERDSKWTS